MTFYTRNGVTSRVHHIRQVIYCQFYYFDSAFFAVRYHVFIQSKLRKTKYNVLTGLTEPRTE